MRRFEAHRGLGATGDCIWRKFVTSNGKPVELSIKASFSMKGDPSTRGASLFPILSALETSLKRLQADQIDVCHLHLYDRRTGFEEAMLASSSAVNREKPTRSSLLPIRVFALVYFDPPLWHVRVPVRQCITTSPTIDERRTIGTDLTASCRGL